MMMRYEGKVCPPPEDAGMIGLVVAKFNRNITERLLSGALATLRQHHVPDQKIRVFWVPGAFEISHVASRLLQTGDYAAVICLGAVIRGDTDHHLYINQSVSSSLSWLQTASDTPVIFGVLTCDTIEQALARCGGTTSHDKDKTVDATAGHKGVEAAEAALEMIDLISDMPTVPPINSPAHRKDVKEDDDGDEDGANLFFEAIGSDPRFLQKFHSFIQQMGLLDDDDCEDEEEVVKKKPTKKAAKKASKTAKKKARE